MKTPPQKVVKVKAYMNIWSDTGWQVTPSKMSDESARKLKLKVYPCTITYTPPVKHKRK